MNATYRRKGPFAQCCAVAIVWLLSGAINAHAAQPFDIPAQPLAKAVLEFSRQSGIDVLAAAELLEGKQSVAIKGEIEPIDALRQLLGNSRMAVTEESDGALTIHEPRIEPDDEPDGGPAEDESLQSAGGNTPLALRDVIVTGSRLINDANKLTRQVTVFTRQEIESSGLLRLHEFLDRLPSNVNAPNNVGAGNFLQSENFGLGKNLFAGNTANIRGLGARYTLILIDGRRPAKGGQFADIVDISNIPLSRIKRIEILYDGAAAIYGADAVGGVINIITDREYDGSSLTATYETTEEGGGNRFNFHAARTFQWTLGSLTVDFSHERQDGIDGAQRDIRFINSLPVAPGAPGNLGLGFDRIVPSPLFYVKDLDGDGQTTSRTGIDPAFAAAYDGHFGVPPGFFSSRLQGERIRADLPGIGFSYNLFALFSPGGFISPEDFGYTPIFEAGIPAAYTGAQPLSIYDFEEGFALNTLPLQQGYSLTPEDDKNSISVSIDQDINDDLVFSGTLSYGRSEKFVQTSNGVRLVNVGSPDALPAAPDPFGVAAAYSLYTDLPQQSQAIEQESESASATLTWRMTDEWEMTFAGGYSANTNESLNVNQINSGLFSFLSRGGRRSFEDGQFVVEEPDPSLNIFAPNLGYATREEYLAAALLDGMGAKTKSRLVEADVRIQGPLYELPAGNVLSGFTVGYRREDSSLVSTILGLESTSISLGIPEAGGGQSGDFDEEFGDSVVSLGAELTVPVLDRFLINVQGRGEQYSNIDDRSENWSIGFNWEPTDWFITRWNRSYSVRVPAAARFAREETLRRGATFAYDASRLNLVGFVPAEFRQGANEGMRPERNYLSSLSFIFRPASIPGLDIRINMYQSDTVDQIQSLSERLRFTQAEFADPAFVSGHPLLAPSTTDGVAVIVDARETNTGGTENRGIDTEVNYQYNSGFGTWSATLRHNYVVKNIVRESGFCDAGLCFDFGGNRQNSEPIDTVGTLDRSLNLISVINPLPEHRASLIVSWFLRGLTVTLDTIYTSNTSIISEKSLTEFNPATFSPVTLSSVIERTTLPPRGINLSVGYDFSGDLIPVPGWLNKTRVSLTVTNLYERKSGIEDRVISSSFEGLVPFEELFNLINLNPRGRTFTLNIATTF